MNFDNNPKYVLLSNEDRIKEKSFDLKIVSPEGYVKYYRYADWVPEEERIKGIRKIYLNNHKNIVVHNCINPKCIDCSCEEINTNDKFDDDIESYFT
jgi:hypothetical protein